MSFQLQKKLMNVFTFWYLLRLDKTMSANPQKAKKQAYQVFLPDKPLSEII